MARSRTVSGRVRRWCAGAGLIVSVALIGAVPAIAGSPVAVTVTDSAPATSLPGRLPLGGPSSGAYPAEPDPDGTATTTPGRVFTAQRAGGDPVGVACLELCGTDRASGYAVDPDAVENEIVTAILGAAGLTPGALDGPDEAAAVQAAIWYATVGFVLNGQVDESIRVRVAELVAAGQAATGGDVADAAGVLPAGTILVADEPSAPRLVLTADLMIDQDATGADQIVAAEEAGSDSTTASSDSSSGPSTTSSDPTTATTTSGPTTAGTTTSTETSTSSTTQSGTSTATSSPSTSSSSASSSVSYQNCAAVWASISRSLRTGEPGYARDLDADADGIACEVNPTYTNSTSLSAYSAYSAAATGGTSATVGSTLPVTGVAPGRAVGVGAALLGLGAAIVLLTRRSGPGAHW